MHPCEKHDIWFCGVEVKELFVDLDNPYFQSLTSSDNWTQSFAFISVLQESKKTAWGSPRFGTLPRLLEERTCTWTTPFDLDVLGDDASKVTEDAVNLRDSTSSFSLLYICDILHFCTFGFWIDWMRTLELPYYLNQVGYTRDIWIQWFCSIDNRRLSSFIICSYHECLWVGFSRVILSDSILCTYQMREKGPLFQNSITNRLDWYGLGLCGNWRHDYTISPYIVGSEIGACTVLDTGKFLCC